VRRAGAPVLLAALAAACASAGSEPRVGFDPDGAWALQPVVASRVVGV